MTEEIELPIWFPNYKNNPGIVSKELKSQIQQMTEHFQVTVGEGEFDGFERYHLTLTLENPDYKQYILQQVARKLGKFTDPEELEVGDILLSRVHSPGKVGFGIFTDIGIRQNGHQNDALLPLYQLREDLELEDISNREIVKMLGWVDGYPVPVEITSISREKKLKIDVKLEEEFINTIFEWSEVGKERLLLTKALKSSISNQVKKQNLDRFIDEIYSVDPLTTVIICKNRTNASGILPKIGARLNKVPIGIFHP